MGFLGRGSNTFARESLARNHQEYSMNSFQSKDLEGSGSKRSAPIVLDEETLKQVSGGATVGDPGWLKSPSGQAQAAIVIGDPGW
jgi:hypothetical protein